MRTPLMVVERRIGIARRRSVSGHADLPMVKETGSGIGGWGKSAGVRTYRLVWERGPAGIRIREMRSEDGDVVSSTNRRSAQRQTTDRVSVHAPAGRKSMVMHAGIARNAHWHALVPPSRD